MLPLEHIGHTIMNNEEGKSRATFCLPSVLFDTYFNNLPVAWSYIMWCVYISTLHCPCRAKLTSWEVEKSLKTKWNSWERCYKIHRTSLRFCANNTRSDWQRAKSNKKSLWAQSLSLSRSWCSPNDAKHHFKLPSAIYICVCNSNFFSY
jgi:hypothetical protein